MLLRLLAALLSLCAAGTIIYFFFTAKLLPLLLCWLWKRLCFACCGRARCASFPGWQRTPRGLELFSAILQRLEQEPFTSPRLQRFAAELKRAARLPRKRFVVWLASFTGSMRARVCWRQIMELPFLYTVQTAMAAEAWRRQ